MSGLYQQFTKLSFLYRNRGFESHSLRKIMNKMRKRFMTVFCARRWASKDGSGSLSARKGAVWAVYRCPSQLTDFEEFFCKKISVTESHSLFLILLSNQTVLRID